MSSARLPTTASSRKRVALFAGAYNHIADGVALTLNNLVDSNARTFRFACSPLRLRTPPSNKHCGPDMPPTSAGSRT